ncbi:MAG: LytR/AlgR family response regulator transcription factor [Sphingobacteriales bacterium]
MKNNIQNHNSGNLKLTSVSANNELANLGSIKNTLANYLNNTISEELITHDCVHVLLIESDENSLKDLQIKLKYVPNISIEGQYTSIAGAFEFISRTDLPIDIIICNADICEGNASTLFSHLAATTPIILISNSDRLIPKALIYNCLYHFSTPIECQELVKTFSIFSKLKYQLQKNNLSKHQDLNKGAKQRLVGKFGIENVVLLIEDIALFFTQNNIVFAVTRENKRIIIEKKLNVLERELMQVGFFRISRQYLVNIKFIKGYKPLEKVKLLIHLKDLTLSDPLVVSQDYTPGFKKWIESN